MIHHPVVQDAGRSGREADALLAALEICHVQVLALMPNSDAGSANVRSVLEAAQAAGRIRLATHFSRPDYVSVLAACDLMIGNSSSGIIEAATFGTPVINVGDRQNMRERNANVLDVAGSKDQIVQAVRAALARGRFEASNVYGDGQTAQRIAKLFQDLPLNDAILRKINVY
jgi:GDP/UDP-N,N'-diacetylbacillosamine 2-epimerase (hydrolysing)